MTPKLIFIIGVILSLAVNAGGRYWVTVLKEALQAAVTECEKAPTHQEGLELISKPVCDPLILLRLDDRQGRQKWIVDTYLERIKVRDGYLMLIIGILFICSIPLLWQFLLNRIRELSVAIRGK